MDFKTRLEPHERSVLIRIRKDYFVPYSPCPVSIDIKTTGQRLDENGDFVIGCKATDIYVTHLLHEMAHFAEREIDKLLLRPTEGWGYSYGKYWEIGNQSGYEPSTDQSVRRELRIWAYQHNLEKKYGIEQPIEDLVRAIVWDSAFTFYHSYHDVERKRFRSEKDRLVIAANEVKELADTTYTLDTFDKAWDERIRVLRNQSYANSMVTQRKATA